jgi:hypothetical protein
MDPIVAASIGSGVTLVLSLLTGAIAYGRLRQRVDDHDGEIDGLRTSRHEQGNKIAVLWSEHELRGQRRRWNDHL